MKTKMYLLTLAGGGDIEYRLVDKEVWDWIFSPRPIFNRNSALDPMVPDSIKQAIFKDCYTKHPRPTDPKRWEDVTVRVTSGTCENDRMLSAYCSVGSESCIFFSHKELNKFIAKHNIEIVDEADGGIY